MKCRAWNDLVKDCRSWLKVAGSTLRINWQRIRAKFHDYIIQNWIKIGDMNEWDRVAANVNKGESFKDINLWMDSTEFPIAGSRSISKKSLSWSFKCNGAGVKFMTICDARGYVRFISPAYTPKLYDSHWLKMNRHYMEEKFKGATIIADCHFEQGRSMFKNVSFKTPIPEPRQSKRCADGVEVPQLNQASQQYNDEHKRLRSRVEDTYGRIKNFFNILEKPFSEGQEQLEFLVNIACGIINKSN